jgi:hypothetical protein
MQETQALTFKDTFFASLKMYYDEIKERYVQRKRFESRRCVDREQTSNSLMLTTSCRLSYHAAMSKVEQLRDSKKDGNRRALTSRPTNLHSALKEFDRDYASKYDEDLKTSFILVSRCISALLTHH